MMLNVAQATDETFDEEVIERSRERDVLVVWTAIWAWKNCQFAIGAAQEFAREEGLAVVEADTHRAINEASKRGILGTVPSFSLFLGGEETARIPFIRINGSSLREAFFGDRVA